MKIFRPTYKDKVTGEVKRMTNYYVYHRGRRYPLHVSDRRTAETKARDLISKLELGHDVKRIDDSKASKLAALFVEFLESLRAGREQVEGLRYRLNKLARGMKVSRLSDMTAERCRVWLRAAPLSKRTKHHYTRAIKQFGKWLVTTERVTKNPFEGLESVTGIETDRKLSRRALTESEIVRFISSVSASSKVRGEMVGTDRAMLYRFVLATGLRREEAGSLLPGAFRLASNTPHVLVAAGATKNKKEVLQPLPLALAAELAVYLQGKDPSRPVWRISGKRTANMVRGDLEEAGIPVMVEGKVIDWHALRTTFGTRLALSGVPLVMASKLLRHSDVRLTIQVYTIVGLSDLQKELEKLA